MFRQALAGACPNCGERGIWRSWGQLHEDCPRCGLHFEAEEGYFVGGLIISMALVEGLIGGGLILWGVLTFPDVPWNALLVVGLLASIALPVLAYPRTKTLWIWFDRRSKLHTGEERAAGLGP